MEDKIIYHKIGTRIRNARKRKGLTQAELGDMVDISWKHIGAVERGEKNIETIHNLVNLMKALELSPNELFCDYVKTADVILKNEYAEILEDCTFEQIQAINKITKVLKDELKEYIPDDNNK